jgi:DNA-binding response OmpR family regulator
MGSMNTGVASRVDRTRPIVMVVDDERVIANTLAVILNQQATSMAFYDGESALDAAHRIAPDLLLADVVMPGMSGVELAIAMKNVAPQCKVLLFSGQATTINLLADARAAGHNFTLLQKPIHPTDLLARISELLH